LQQILLGFQHQSKAAIQMLKANLKIIEELKLFLKIVHQIPEVRRLFSVKEADFSRDRILSMQRLVLLIAKLCKKTLSVEVDSFFRELEVEMPCSASAFSQQRMKLVPELFKVWNRLLTDSFYKHYGADVKRWKNYRLIAADGSSISLVNIQPLAEHFGGQRNQESFFVQGRLFGYYDVLNSLMVKFHLYPYRISELPIAYSQIDSLEDDTVTIYDRYFCNFKMIALHLWQENEKKFIIRGKERLKFIKEFIANKKKSDVIYIVPTPNCITSMAKCGFKIDRHTTLKIRLVRIDLLNTTEVLVTNLWEEEGHAVEELQELYGKRWCIETGFSKLKNILQLESFSGQTVQSVYQDVFASVFISNLHSLMIKPAQQILDTGEKKWKYPMKVNNNKSYGRLRESIVELFLTKHPLVILERLNELFIRSPVPIRKGRSFQRVVKNKQSKSKHKTYLNYKPAF
jgi:hypothetical protein